MTEDYEPKTLTQQLACAKRELRMRELVYPKRVANETMTQRQADHEIACMAEIVVSLMRLLRQEEDREQPRLFGNET